MTLFHCLPSTVSRNKNITDVSEDLLPLNHTSWCARARHWTLSWARWIKSTFSVKSVVDKIIEHGKRKENTLFYDEPFSTILRHFTSEKRMSALLDRSILILVAEEVQCLCICLVWLGGGGGELNVDSCYPWIINRTWNVPSGHAKSSAQFHLWLRMGAN
jgi:hypothetical protein